MKVFNYSAVDAEGTPQNGTIKALSRQQAADILRSRSFVVTDLREEYQAQLNGFIKNLRGVPAQDKVVFTRQLGTMIGAGLPISQALRILAEQTGSDYFREIITDVVQQVDGGSSMHNALANYEKVFGRLYLSLIEAGETSGNLETILNRLADTLEAEQAFKSKVKSAMIYPIIVIMVMALVMVVMMFFVIPRLSELYDDLGADLPFMTKVLIAVSKALVKYSWLVIIGVVGLVIGLKQLLKKQEIAREFGRLKKGLPVFGVLTVQVQLTSFTRTLSMLLASGISILEALDIAKETLTNVVFREAADEIARKVEKGKSMSEAFGQDNTFPRMVSEMLKVGEQTGKAEEVLKKLSSYFEQQAERRTENLATAIEPMVMVILGVMVGFMVVSLILPIYSLTSQF